ncbi:hypothetical protein AVEN_171251-1 [Araneus ventricosus]|uniref:Uncharacterized protein n=1 Tax=Araneus ventricosus TaxID=182803 RepID=A0A4Y2H1Z5_ARAVE|nr:hypothetical protein AVEN_171251-1 [Araneus ventricosus]
MPVPSLPDTVKNIFYLDSEFDEVYDSISDEPKPFTHSELNDLVRDLNFPKDSSEVLGSRLEEKNLLAPGAVIEEEGERFHQCIKEMERRYQGKWNVGMIADYCWMLQRESLQSSQEAKCQKNF